MPALFIASNNLLQFFIPAKKNIIDKSYDTRKYNLYNKIKNFKQRIGKEEYMSQRIKRENITQKRIVVSDSV